MKVSQIQRADIGMQTAPIHVLPPGSHFLDVDRTFLISLDVLALCVQLSADERE